MSTEDRKRAVIAAAVRYVATHGFPATSMRAIAAEAQQNMANLYYHFPSKDMLVVNLIEHCAQSIVEALRNAETALGSEGKDRTRRMVASVFTLANQPLLEARVLMDLAAQVSHEPVLRRAVARAFDDIVVAIATQLSTVEGDPTARVVSDVILGTLHGLIVRDCFLDWPSPRGELQARVLEGMARSIQAAMGGVLDVSGGR